MLLFKKKIITNTRQMGRYREKNEIKWIVVHWTGNTSPSANAENHYKYLQHATRYGSAHYYVDSNEIIQTIPDNVEAWSVGDNQGYGRSLNGCTNYNSISIEMCWNAEVDTVVKNTIELIKNLKKIYPNAKLCRHWDVSRKDCPHGATGKNNPKWLKIIEDSKKPIRLLIDFSKDSTAKEIKQVENGWLEYDKKWFYKENGKNHVGWLEYNKNWYYFDNNGYMKKGWLEYKNKNNKISKFYFNKEGKMVKGKQKINNKDYIFDEKGYLIK